MMRKGDYNSLHIGEGMASKLQQATHTSVVKQVAVAVFAKGKGLVSEGISMRVEDAPSGLALRARRPAPLTIGDIERRSARRRAATRPGAWRAVA